MVVEQYEETDHLPKLKYFQQPFGENVVSSKNVGGKKRDLRNLAL
jgi:hypothetical protein